MIFFALIFMVTACSAFASPAEKKYTLGTEQARQVITSTILQRFGYNYGYTYTDQLPKDFKLFLDQAQNMVLQNSSLYTDAMDYGSTRLYLHEKVLEYTLSVVHEYVMYTARKQIDNANLCPETASALTATIETQLLTSLQNNQSLKKFTSENLGKLIHESLERAHKKIRYFNQDDCTICRSELATGNSSERSATPVILPCGHMSCLECLYAWCVQKNVCTCPQCRAPLTLKTLLQKTIIT